MEKSKIDLRKLIEKKGDKNMSYTELYKIISKPWISTKEIRIICQCGERQALNIRHAIEKEVKDNGQYLPNSSVKIVPTPLLLKYLNISESYVYNMARKEKALRGEENVCGED